VVVGTGMKGDAVYTSNASYTHTGSTFIRSNMGLCRSCLRSLLVPATWAKQRAKLEKNKAAIQKNLHEVQVSEFENSAVIKKMKQTCNDIYVGAEARRKKLGLRQIRYTDDEQRAMKQKMSEIQLKLGEVQMQRANMAMYQKAYASITTFIVQQETVTKMKETMRGVKDVGLDIDAAESALMNAAKTTDEMELMSHSIADRLSASAFGDSSLLSDAFDFASGRMPFTDIDEMYIPPSFDDESKEMEESHAEDMPLMQQRMPEHARNAEALV
jgi:hypothetical protein